jgi:hypothetical protein
MSSASKGRYQSRLFNFFHKQSRRFGEGFGRSLRQLQVATSWSVEVLSKTVYLLLKKAVDSAGTQLSAAGGEPKLQLQQKDPPLAADTAIVRVLESVETRYIPSSTFQSKKMLTGASCSISHQPSGVIQTSQQDARTTLKNSAQKIQGIASQLFSQNLVLVTSENEILDILTPSQQQALQNQIISEIAKYWRFWRLSQVKEETKLYDKVNGFLKRIADGNANTKKPYRALNPTEKEYKYLQINPATLASLDTAVAKLETNALAPVSRATIVVKQRGGELIKVVRTKLDIFLYGDTLCVTPEAYRQVTVSTKQVLSDDNLETQKSKIQALIRAALNYFYGESKSKKIKPTPQTRYISSTKPNPQLQSQQSTDDWLTLGDLFNSEFTQGNQTNQVSNKVELNYKQLNPSTQENNSSKKLFERFQIPNWRTLRLKERAGLQKPKKPIKQSGQDDIRKSGEDGYITKSGQDAPTTNNQVTSGSFQKITITAAKKLQSENKGEITQIQSRESTQVEAKPEWIETSCEIVGYQKHPLEQLLAFIDGTFVKIEEVFIKIANALVQLWRK